MTANALIEKKRFLTVFDLETTGLDKKKDYIIEFAAIKVDQETKKIVKSIDLYIKPSGSYSISLGAYYTHGITPQMLEDKPVFAEVMPQILEFFGPDVDVLTYNGTSFDLSFLAIEFGRNGIEFTLLDHNNYDAFREEVRRYGNSLGESFKRYYGCTMEEKGLRAHNALSDVKATYMVYVAQQEKQEYGPENLLTEDNVIKMMEFKGKEMACFSIGKYRQVPVEVVLQIDRGYLDWVMGASCSFSPSCKRFVKDFIEANENNV